LKQVETILVITIAAITLYQLTRCCRKMVRTVFDQL